MTNLNITKENIDFVFNQNTDLVNIGTKEQYLEYLNTIFPDSKIKDIVYHGTNSQFDKFDKSKIGTNASLVELSKLGFFFTDNRRVSDFYGKTKPCLINLRNPAKIRDEYGNVVGAALGDIENTIKNSDNIDGVIL